MGCLVHHKLGLPRDSAADYFDVAPVEIVWEEGEEEVNERARAQPAPSAEPASPTPSNGPRDFCVYPHLNDELYRYCLMVHERKSEHGCWSHNGHTVCCCFVRPGERGTPECFRC